MTHFTIYHNMSDRKHCALFQRKIHNKQILVILTHVHGSDRVHFDRLNNVYPYLLVPTIKGTHIYLPVRGLNFHGNSRTLYKLH